MEATLTLTREYARLYPDEVAADLEPENRDNIIAVLRQLEPRLAGMLLNRFVPTVRARVLAALNEEWGAQIVRVLDPVRLAIALIQLPEDIRTRLLGYLPRAARQELQELLTYPISSAWHLMEANVMTFHRSRKAGNALRQLQDANVRNTSRFYLLDNDGLLSGSVRLQDIALAPDETPLGEIARPVAIAVRATDPSDEVMRLFEAGNTSSLPVTDFNGRFLGVIRYQGLVNAAQEEALAGIQSMVGASPDEGALSSPWFSVRKRLPWLQINLLTAFLAASVVGLFENLIAQFTALAVLLPVVAGQSGNTGAQALAVTLRGLTLKEIRLGQWFSLIRKELVAALINGCAVAAVTGLGVFLWSRSIGLVVVISVSMVIAMMIAGCAGAAIPIILKACKQDPAQSSSIILTTVTDVFGFLSFLGLAAALSRFL